MIFRIIAKNKEKTEAYAERLESYKVMPDGETVFCIDLKGSGNFSSLSDIIENPTIIRTCSAPWLYKIRLDSEKE